MVGVPGRSKGCNTCRRRRVKCDEAKPVCNRCTKAGFDCLGYERAQIWHHKSTAPFPDRTETEPVKATESGKDVATLSLALSQTHTSPPPPPPELSLVAFQGEFCFAALFANFVHRSYGGIWMAQASEGKLGGLSLDAATALAQITFGRLHRATAQQLQGVKQYGSCLRTAAACVSGGGAGRELLIPVLLLLMFSNAEYDSQGTMTHAQGIARLLYMCGPQAFQEQPFRSALETARASLTIGHLIQRQRCFLADEAWRTVPWALDPASKSQQNHLIDILVQVPGLLQDHQEALQAMDAQTGPLSGLEPILGAVQTLLVRLCTWRWRWQASHGHLFSVVCSPPPPAVSWLSSASTTLADPPEAAAQLVFRSFSAAMDLMVYNAVFLWLLALLWKIDPAGAAMRVEVCAEAARVECPMMLILGSSSSSSSSSSTASPLLPMPPPVALPGQATGLRDAALEVCRIFAWVSQNHHRSRGDEPANLYLFPVGMALGVLGREPAYHAWMRRMLDSCPITANYGRGGTSNPAGFGFYMNMDTLHPANMKAFVETPASVAGGRHELAIRTAMVVAAVEAD